MNDFACLLVIGARHGGRPCKPQPGFDINHGVASHYRTTISIGNMSRSLTITTFGSR
jgi:hypothetical protein